LSRAFVKEDGQREARPRPSEALPAGTPNLVTPEGHAAFTRALTDARALRRALVAAGDELSLARVSDVDDDIGWLEERIASFVVTAPPAAPERVGFGVWVTIDDGTQERQFRVVGVPEADASEGRISFISPLARALFGARVGDDVLVRLPRGELSFAVVAIAGRPDR